jgi:hypothetical protein
VQAPLSEGQVAGWASGLLSNGDALQDFIDRRGIERETLREFQIGWDSTFKCYTIPVRSIDGALVNVRRYQLDPPDDRRKIWSLPGRGSPVLFPGHLIPFLGQTVIICEGELDAICTMQHGFDAVTRTGSAKTWKGEWNGLFRGKMVYVVHDADEAGQDGNRIVAAALEDVAAELYVVQLPYSVTPNHGKDLTDWWLEGHTAEEFIELLYQAEPWGPLQESPIESTMVDITLLESLDAAKVGQRLRTRVTITGKQSGIYILPEEVEYNCDMNAGMRCLGCPMFKEGFNGKTSITISRSDPMVLKFLGATDKTVSDLLRAQVTSVKCGHLNIDANSTMSVEELYVRPSVEQYRINNTAGDYTHRKVVSVGRHDTMPNNTVEVVGTIYPSPRTQHNEFQAWHVEQTKTSVDNFKATPEQIRVMEQLRPQPRQSPLEKLIEISTDLEAHVTQIYGRTMMHALMDLTFHSALAYNFDGKLEPKGWLDVIVVGDTRTGKTEAAKRLIAWFGAGEYVSCEAASFAGVVGGLQQYGGKEWTVTWGAVPINDRRLVVLDEVSGLTTEQIAQMSSIRSSGEAQLTKIQSERTWARTRLIWSGNPRDGKTMSSYTYGAQAIQPLIGNNEDVARFDLAMSVAETEVSSEEINRQHPHTDQVYGQEVCMLGVQWAWSRTAEDIVWEKGAEALVYTYAIDMGDRYTPKPPLVQAANIRMKITRVAVALAIRTFSTDNGQRVLVTKQHVDDAVLFMDQLYGMEGFGYLEHSKELILEATQSVENRQSVVKYLRSKPEIARFLRGMGEFRRSDMEDMMNYTKEEANAVVNRLWEWRMVTRAPGAMVLINPELHDIIRELSE